MGKIKFLVIALLLALIGCSKDVEKEYPKEMYGNTYPYLLQSDIYNNELVTIHCYNYNSVLPTEYKYIKSVEYFVDGNSIGMSDISPYSISYTPNLTLGTHLLSMRFTLNTSNVIWETKELAFCVIEKPKKYTPEQSKTLPYLNGLWYDTKYVNVGISTCITFGEQYESPKTIIETTIEKTYAHGECTFQQSSNGLSADIERCFYYLSDCSTKITLYQESDKAIFSVFDISIVGQNEIHINDNRLSMMYIFIKQ